MIWSLLDVQCEVNFFTKKDWSYVGCMKFCQNMGGRSPPVRTKKELDDLKGMLEDLKAFPPFPQRLFLPVTSGEVDEADDHLTLEHWPKDIRDAKDGVWRDYYTGEELENYNGTNIFDFYSGEEIENYNETWGDENVGSSNCAGVDILNESLEWLHIPCSRMMNGTYSVCPCLQQKRLLLPPRV